MNIYELNFRYDRSATKTPSLVHFSKGASINHVDMEGGRGVSQMSMLLHKPYLVKWSAKGEGGQKSPKNCPHGLWMPPYVDVHRCV